MNYNWRADLASRMQHDIRAELLNAMDKHGPLNSHHEAYAVILEELDEYWDMVKLKKSERSPSKMYRELVQIAAMAMRSAIELIPPNKWSDE